MSEQKEEQQPVVETTPVAVPEEKKEEAAAAAAAPAAVAEEKKEEEEEKTETGSKKRKSNVVSDPSTLPASSDHAEILKQVEFYFSDQNLPKDKFLLGLTKENEGWVPITTIAMFGRMRRFSPIEAIVEALKKSEDLLEVSEDSELVRRKVPLETPEESETKDGKTQSKGAQAFARSIYAKGFGEETATSQYDIEKFFEEFAPVKQVRLRRSDDKKFKGSVFVEFAVLEDAQNFLAKDPKPEFNGTQLLTMSKAAYVDMKSAEHGFTKNARGNGGKFKKGGFNKKRKYEGKNNRGDKKAKTDA